MLSYDLRFGRSPKRENCNSVDRIVPHLELGRGGLLKRLWL
jgi:hypothetical protein